VKREKFWTINVGHCLTIAAWVLSLAVAYGKISKVIEEHEAKIEDIRKSQLEIVTKSMPEISERLAVVKADVRWLKEAARNHSVVGTYNNTEKKTSD